MVFTITLESLTWFAQGHYTDLTYIDILNHEEEDNHEVDLRTECVLEDESEFILSDEENSYSATAHAHSKEDKLLP